MGPYISITNSMENLMTPYEKHLCAVAILTAIIIIFDYMIETVQHRLSFFDAKNLNMLYKGNPQFRHMAESRGTLSHREIRIERHDQIELIKLELAE